MEQKTTNNKRTIFIAAAVLLALVAIFGIVLSQNRMDAQPGAKTISIRILHAQALQRELKLKTDAQTLREALEEEGLIMGTESAFGLFVTSVDGVQADDGKQEWWCFSKDGEQLFTGVDETPIADGDSFEITLTTGY